MRAYWSNEIEEYHGEKLILSKACCILSEAGIKHINSNQEFEHRLLMAINEAAQDASFERLKSFATEEQYADLKEDIALEPYFFGEEYYAQLKAGISKSKIDINGVVISSNMALVEKLLIEVEIGNPSIEPWNDEFISVLLDGIELELAARDTSSPALAALTPYLIELISQVDCSAVISLITTSDSCLKNK